MECPKNIEDYVTTQAKFLDVVKNTAIAQGLPHHILMTLIPIKISSRGFLHAQSYRKSNGNTTQTNILRNIRAAGDSTDCSGANSYHHVLLEIIVFM